MGVTTFEVCVGELFIGKSLKPTIFISLLHFFVFFATLSAIMLSTS